MITQESLLRMFEYRDDRWRARITIDGKPKCLGSFGTKEEARLAYV